MEQNIEMLSLQDRPLSGKQHQDSFMSDADAKDNPPQIDEHQIQMATEEQQRGFDEDSGFTSSYTSQNDVSEETYQV